MQFTDTFPYFNYRSRKTVLPILIFIEILAIFALFTWLEIRKNNKNKKVYTNDPTLTTSDNLILPQTVADKEVEPKKKSVPELIWYIVMGRVSKSRCNLRACAAKARLNRHKIADKFSVELSSMSNDTLKDCVQEANNARKNKKADMKSKLKNLKIHSKVMHSSKRSIKNNIEKEFLVEELNRYKEKEAAMNLEEQTESGLEEDTCEIMQLERRDKVVATVEETRRTPTKRKESSSTKREFNTLSRSGKKKRISKFKRSLSQNLPPSYRITKSPLKEPTVEESINLLISGNVTEKTYQKVRNLSTKPVVSRYSVRKEMLKLQKEYGEATEFKVGERLGLYFKPKPVIISRIKWKNQTFTKLQIVLSGDCGAGITKFCLFLPHANISQSPFNISILGYYGGGDDYNSLLELLNYIGDDLEDISRNGIIIVGERVEIEFLAVGDLKFLPALMGLQGGSSDSFCPWCHITRNQVKIDGFRAGKRTSEDLILNAQQCESELKTNKKSKAASIRRKYGSVKGTPLIKFIQPEQLVPPPFHLLAQLVDSSIKYVTKNLNNTTLEDAIVQLNLNIHYPSQSLNGNESRKLLEKIRKREVVIEEPGLELFLAAADVEQFAVARVLEEAEIDQLEICIGRLFNIIRGFKDFPIGNKLHGLECHVVDFVRNYKSWGLYGEQSTESIHHVCNVLEARIKGNNEEAVKKKQKFVTNQIIARNYIQK